MDAKESYCLWTNNKADVSSVTFEKKTRWQTFSESGNRSAWGFLGALQREAARWLEVLPSFHPYEIAAFEILNGWVGGQLHLRRFKILRAVCWCHTHLTSVYCHLIDWNSLFPQVTPFKIFKLPSHVWTNLKQKATELIFTQVVTENIIWVFCRECFH